MKKRPHVEHDWKDRTLKLVETKREMQQRIDNLSTALDEEVMTANLWVKRNFELISENEVLCDCAKRMEIWLCVAVSVIIGLIASLAVILWRNWQCLTF